MNNRFILFTIFFLFSISLAYGVVTEYPVVGYANYVQGDSLFTEGFDDAAYVGKGITLPSGTPILCDIDGDTISDIIIKSNNVIVIYQGESLTYLGGKAYASANSSISNIVCQDIDSSGENNIIFYDNGEHSIKGFHYNGTEIVWTFNHSAVDNISNSNPTAQLHSMLGCDGSYCLVGIDQIASPVFDTQKWDFLSFDVNSIIERYDPGTSDVWNACSPSVLSVPVIDSDRDGIKEYHFGGYYSDPTGGQGDGFWIRTLSINSSGSITPEHYVTYGDEHGMFDEFTTTDAWECGLGTVKNFLASPVTVADINLVPSDGYELIMAVVTDSGNEEYHIYTINPITFNVIDHYPNTYTPNAVRVSNVFIANIFGDTDTVDFCAMGIDSSGIVDVTCGSPLTGSYLADSIIYHMQGTYYLPQSSQLYSLMAHSVNSEIDAASEVLTTFGILDFNSVTTTCQLTNLCQGTYDFHNIKGEAASLSVDAGNVGYDDMILLTNTTLWYIDDERSNFNCKEQSCLTRIKICPPEGSSWKQNTTVEFIINTSEIDGNNVFFNISLYYGRTYQVNSSNRNVSANTITSEYFTVVNLTNYDLWHIEVWESNEPDEVFAYSGSFSVSNIGAEYGDGCSVITFDPIIDADDDGVTDDDDGDAITNTIETFTQSSGLPKSIIWLGIMIIVALTIIIPVANQGQPMLAVLITAFIEFILLIVGTILGYLPIAYLISLIVIGILLIGFGVSKIITQTRSGG